MKRCPQCNRVETDDQLAFCRVDGAPLTTDSLSSSETATAHLSSSTGSNEATTSVLPHTTNAGFKRNTGPTTGLPAEPLPSQTSELATKKRRTMIVAIVAVAAVSVVALMAVVSYFALTKKDKAIDSVAVLPFEDKSGNPDSEYLSEGLTESLIYRLSQLPNLKVSPTGAVLRYKGQAADAIKAGNELGVSAVMSGRMVQRGDNLTLSVELVDVRNNKLLWGEQYERKMSELMTTQREIATEIASKLQLKLTGDQTKGLTKQYTVSNEAYQLYLKGRFYWNKRNEENLKKAIEQFRAAADKDPGFALAFSGLADCYSVLPFYRNSTSTDSREEARAYAKRALEIDDSLSEAHTSLAYVNSSSWNFAEAEEGFKKAISLNPEYATAHKWYGNQLAAMARFDEALAEYKKAQELDPLSMITCANIAEVLAVQGQFDAAVAQSQRAIALDPNWYYAREVLSLIYLKQGRTADALAEAQLSVELSKRRSQSLAVLSYVLAQTGKRKEAEALGNELKEMYNKHEATGLELACVYLGLGEKDQTYEWLDKDLVAHSPTLPSLLTNPPFDTLRNEPRYKELRKRIGTPV